jgi:septal ring-binding cell division protein DamX
MATGPKGETYTSLTDNFGNYVISVPKADKFKVHINNVFGLHFYIDTNESEVQFTTNKTINYDFIFIEKKRGIQFEGGNELFKFSSLDSPNEMPSKVLEPATTVNYAILLSTIKIYRAPSFYKNKYKLKEEVYYTDNNGLYKYYTGSYTSMEAAKAAIIKLRITAIPVAIDKSLLKTAPVINQQVATATSDKVAPKTIPAPTVKSQKESKNVDTIPQPVNAKQPLKSTVSPAENQKANDKGLSIIDGKVVTNQPAAETTHKPDSIITKVKAAGKNQLPVSQPVAPKTDSVSKQTTIPADDTKIKPLENPLTSESGIEENKYMYSIQLDVQNTYIDPTYYKKKYNLNEDVLFMERKGEFVYYTGNYNTIDAAKAAITRYGLMGYIVSVDRKLLKKSK